MTFIETRDRVRLFVDVQVASDEAPWIVFSNSVLTDLRIWDGQIEALKGHWNILRYDQRGHGKSDVVPGPLSFETLGLDVLDLLDAHGILKATYVGLSMGVPTGLAAFSIRPDRFSRLVLVDGQAASSETSPAFWDQRISLATEEGMRAVANVTTERWLKAEHSSSDRQSALASMVAATHVGGFVAAAEALRSYDQTAALHALTIPLRLIAGSEDGAIPDAMRHMAAVVPGATMSLVAGCGHVPNFEAPDQFNNLLQQALE